MFDWAGLLLKAVYYYGHLIGLSNFEFDWRTGRVFIAKRSTFYAIAINAIMFMLLILQSTKKLDLNMIIGRSNKLVQYVLIIVLGMRIAAGFSAILVRWRQRTQMMRLTKMVIRIFLQKPQVIRMSRWDILIKFILACTTDFLQMAITWNAMGHSEANQILPMVVQFWMSAVINLATSQHYLVILFVRAYYHLLNRELRQVIEECKELSNHPQRKGAFMTRCCSLSDRLEIIAKLQTQLQSTVTQLHEVFALQGLMVFGGYYILSIATAYLTYSILKNGYENLEMTLVMMILSFTWSFFFYLDAILNLFMTLNLIDDHKEMIRLLDQRTIFASRLDVRLEETFDSMQLQMIRDPFKIKIFKTFTITRSSTSVMFGSLITNSIFLIQYDLENF
uniref:Gustatory receptor n=1 Tax=Drosophila rhopaloa TaxID=1041015 RepID=A0A6P4EXS1_DRORH